MATEPFQAGPYPVPGDAPDSPTQIKAVVDWAAPRLNMRFTTTAARDAAIPAPVEGMECVTGTGAAQVKWLYRNAGWCDVTVRDPASFTPVLGPNASNYTAVGRHIQIGKLVTYWFMINLNASFSIGGGTMTVSVPVPGQTGVGSTSGIVRLYHAGSAHLGARVSLLSSTTCEFQATATFGGGLSNVTYIVPWAWAAGDIIDGFITYEAV